MASPVCVGMGEGVSGDEVRVEGTIGGGAVKVGGGTKVGVAGSLRLQANALKTKVKKQRGSAQSRFMARLL